MYKLCEFGQKCLLCNEDKSFFANICPCLIPKILVSEADKFAINRGDSFSFDYKPIEIPFGS